MQPFEDEIKKTQEWFGTPRCDGILRVYSAREVVLQRGTIRDDYRVACEAEDAFHA